MKPNLHSLENRTHISNGFVWHYTCNAPELEVLARAGIDPIGDRYGCKDSREVLLIPQGLYKKYGLRLTNDSLLLPLQSEILLRKLPYQKF